MAPTKKQRPASRVKRARTARATPATSSVPAPAEPVRDTLARPRWTMDEDVDDTLAAMDAAAAPSERRTDLVRRRA